MQRITPQLCLDVRTAAESMCRLGFFCLLFFPGAPTGQTHPEASGQRNLYSLSRSALRTQRSALRTQKKWTAAAEKDTRHLANPPGSCSQCHGLCQGRQHPSRKVYRMTEYKKHFIMENKSPWQRGQERFSWSYKDGQDVSQQKGKNIQANIKNWISAL